MLKFPQNVIEAFVYDQFEKYKIQETGAGTEIRFNGPFEPDKRFRMFINVEKNLVHDFNTGYSNTFIGFVSDYLDLSYSEAQHYIIKNYLNYKSLKEVIKPYKPSVRIVELEEINEPPGLSRISPKTYYGKLAIKLLAKKHISALQIKKFKLQCFTEGYYKGRLYIPFYMNNKLVFFQARDLLGEKKWLEEHKRSRKYKKYENPKGIPKSQILFNYDNINNKESVVVVEGPFDAMTTKNAVAILGNTISRAQAKKIALKSPKRVIFIPDNDEAGKNTLEKNMKIMKEVAPEVDVGYYEVDKKYKDANEAGLTDIKDSKIKKDPLLERIKDRVYNSKEKVAINSFSNKYSSIKAKLQKVKII